MAFTCAVKIHVNNGLSLDFGCSGKNKILMFFVMTVRRIILSSFFYWSSFKLIS